MCNDFRYRMPVERLVAVLTGDRVETALSGGDSEWRWRPLEALAPGAPLA